MCLKLRGFILRHILTGGLTIKYDKTTAICNTRGEDDNGVQYFVGKSRLRKEDNIKTDVKQDVWMSFGFNWHRIR